MGSESEEDSLLYSFFTKSNARTQGINTVPVSLRDDKKASAYTYSTLGYKNFFPWFVADANPACTDDYFKVLVEILSFADANIEEEEYWFFRADVNILMMFLRVILLGFLGAPIFCS